MKKSCDAVQQTWEQALEANVIYLLH